MQCSSYEAYAWNIYAVSARSCIVKRHNNSNNNDNSIIKYYPIVEWSAATVFGSVVLEGFTTCYVRLSYTYSVFVKIIYMLSASKFSSCSC